MFDFITSVLSALGGLGVFLLMLAENIFPPIPSEVILPLAGYTAAQGRDPLWVVIVAGTSGSAAGALLWYYIGRWIGIGRLKQFASRHGRWLTLTPGEIDNVDRWFDRYGHWAVLFGRMLPGIRTLISVPAGVSGMALVPFLLSTFVGSAIWTVILVLAGYELGERYSQVASIVEPVSNVLIVIAGMVYLWRVATFGRSQRQSDRLRK
ncbi:DedA family protein [Sphingomonas crocodyli]|uniref:DedA family protein n=1 Tax=Sphingomonas crocodyli TaxID=1979270 RepID=A0A437M5U7_9SPHN|nr:DedA family protein [Sphingomonas crocodyli]RVT93110.1 DedA family protein [Sphingomonas crocodyli]